jgi:dipeptidyl aminopeptidase/acylaminoacyl peptidase
MPRATLCSIAFAAILVAAAACGGDSSSTPGAGTATTEASPTAAPAVVGPLLVYTSDASDAGGQADRRSYVVTYDAGAHREVARFEIARDSAQSPRITLTPHGVVLIDASARRIVAYDLDGSHERELRRAPDGPNAYTVGIAASPDGSKLALSEQTEPVCGAATETGTKFCDAIAAHTRIAVIDTATGRELMLLPQSDPRFAEFTGQAAVFQWRDDGLGFAVEGYTYTEAPGGLATVLLDGTVRVHSERVYYAYLAPNARYVMADDLRTCDLSSDLERHALALRDLDAGRVLASVREPVLDIEQGEWSPDSTEYLYRTFALKAAGDGCPKADESTAAWHVLRTDGSPPAAVPDADAVRRRWYGDRQVTYTCFGAPVPRAPYCYAPDGSNTGPIAAYVGGQLIASAVGFNLLGFVQD